MSDGYQVKVRPEKVRVVDEIKEQLEASSAVVLTEYRGLTVQELAALREELRKSEVSYKVVKNTLTRFAVTDLGLGELEALLEGPTAIAYVAGDPVAAAKTLATFAKDHPALVIKGGVLEGRVMTADETEALAKVDSREVSLAKIAGGLTAPLQAIVGILEAPLQRILFVLEQAPSWATADGAAAPAGEAPDAAAEAAAPDATGEPAPETTETVEEPQASAEAPEAEPAPEAAEPEATEQGAEEPAAAEEAPAPVEPDEAQGTKEGE